MDPAKTLTWRLGLENFWRSVLGMESLELTWRNSLTLISKLGFLLDPFLAIEANVKRKSVHLAYLLLGLLLLLRQDI
jgi:hypothetical protein